jgi:NAD(P)-dependent dehydrogenase (short-subunit alcohol dehydrogenase family)
MGYWQDKVVLVTGGSSGLGRALAQAFAAAGGKLVLAALDDDLLRDAIATLQAAGHDVLGVPTNVTRDEDVDALLAQALARFGRLDALINCAGRSARGEAATTRPDEFRTLLELNFLATVRCTHGALPHLLQTHGHVVNVGSLAAKTAARFLGAYPASKFPVAAYSHQLRLELKPRGVHVLLVCPGPIARPDAGVRYDGQAAGLPAAARRPGGGVKLKGLPPERVVAKILKYCERRQPELVMPARARLLFAISQLSPTLGDWILGRMTGQGA